MGYASHAAPLRHLRVPAVAGGVPVAVAAGVMRRHGVAGLAVLEGGHVTGVLTEHDLLRCAVLADGRVGTLNVSDVCCRDVARLMTPDPLWLEVETPLVDAAAWMVAAGAASALAVDADGHIRGVVTGRDIAAAAEEAPLDQLTVEDVSVGVEALTLDDGIERAVELGARAQGRPVPVVDDGEAVGTVQIPLSSLSPAAPAVAGPDVPVLRPAPTVVRRPRGGLRFYLRRPRKRP